MIFRLTHFGPIASIEIDLSKDLHFIFGKNSIGKSYATYCLYCLIKSFSNFLLLPPYRMFEQEKTIYDSLTDSVVAKFSDKSKTSVAINTLLQDFIVVQLNKSVTPSLRNSLQNTFSSLANLRNSYSSKQYSIELIYDNGNTLLIKADKNGIPKVKYFEILPKYEILLKETKTTKYTLLKSGTKEFGVATLKEFKESFWRSLTEISTSATLKLSHNIRDIYFLPASRSGLYQALSAFTPILAELTQNRFFMANRTIELPNLPEPLSDYFLDLSTVSIKNDNPELSHLVNQLEMSILGGAVRYNAKSKRITFKPEGMSGELDLSQSSSMVAELAPIVLYLKYIINHKISHSNSRFLYEEYYYYYYTQHMSWSRRIQTFDIMVIEEPEAHLHPSIQIKLLELFAELSNYNIKVIVTSHSSYMFDKLTNLILRSKIDHSKLSVYHMIMGKDGSYLNPDVSVTEEGVPDTNFVESTELLYAERLEAEDDRSNS